MGKVLQSGDVAQVVAKMAGLPESRLTGTDRERILGIESALRGRVVLVFGRDPIGAEKRSLFLRRPLIFNSPPPIAVRRQAPQ